MPINGRYRMRCARDVQVFGVSRFDCLRWFVILTVRDHPGLVRKATSHAEKPGATALFLQRRTIRHDATNEKNDCLQNPHIPPLMHYSVLICSHNALNTHLT